MRNAPVPDSVRERWRSIEPPPAMQWARDIVAKYRAGERVPLQFVRLAMQALDLPTETLVEPPPKRNRRPDVKDRQAGDVDVQW